MGTFLDTLRERVVVFDGATGTNLQTRDLGADDFGGAGPRGLQRDPGRHPAGRSSPSSTGASSRSGSTPSRPTPSAPSPSCWPEYGIAERTFELNQAAARIAKEVASGYSTPDRPRWVIGSIGPGTKLPSLGQIDFVTLRDGYEAQVDGLLAGGVDVLLSRPSTTCSRPRRRSSPAGGPWPGPARTCRSWCR